MTSTKALQFNLEKHAEPHVNCEVCEMLRIQAMQERNLPLLPFKIAARLWYSQHKRYIKPRTAATYAEYLNALFPFFGDIIVGDIHIGHVRHFQDARKAGPYRINNELSTLQQVLKEAGVWSTTQIGSLYRPLPLPKTRSGNALTREQERKLREVAFSQPKWQLAAHCMTVMLSTTMGFGELRRMRRQDVDLDERMIHVRDGAKNDYRDRHIPLNHSAYDSMCWIIERWEKLGGEWPDQFILPHRPRKIGGPWVFDEPMTAINSAFRQIRKAAGLPHFRIYDCRVQAITKLLSDPTVSSQVSKEIAGHISQAMQNRYSIQQIDTKRAALEALEPPKSDGRRPRSSSYRRQEDNEAVDIDDYILA